VRRHAAVRPDYLTPRPRADQHRTPTSDLDVVVYGDTAVLHRAAVDVLLRVGGPLLDGYRAVGGAQAGADPERCGQGQRRIASR
jgi:hypothetical protein